MVIGSVTVIASMNYAESKLDETAKTRAMMETEAAAASTEVLNRAVPQPQVTQQLLSVNDYSRPGKKSGDVVFVVIHEVEKAGATAKETRDYYEGLKDSKKEYNSSNYIVGLDGEIIQCVPDDELVSVEGEEIKGQTGGSVSVAYAHADDTGKQIKNTYVSMVKLTAYLMDHYNLAKESLIRHSDVTGKKCPKFYQDDAQWEQFRSDVMTAADAMKKSVISDADLEKLLKGCANTYADKSKVVKETEPETEKETESETEYYEEDTEYYEEDTEYYEEQYYDEPQQDYYYVDPAQTEYYPPQTEYYPPATEAPAEEPATEAPAEEPAAEEPVDDGSSDGEITDDGNEIEIDDGDIEFDEGDMDLDDVPVGDDDIIFDDGELDAAAADGDETAELTD